MTLFTRNEPVREFSNLQDRLNRMNRLFRESFSSEGPEEALTPPASPRQWTYEDEHTITLKMEVPGW
jgi:HSP20 family protein